MEEWSKSDSENFPFSPTEFLLRSKLRVKKFLQSVARQPEQREGVAGPGPTNLSFPLVAPSSTPVRKANQVELGKKHHQVDLN